MLIYLVCVKVAGVVGRAESLSAIFFIASISAYQNAIQKAQGIGE